MRDTAKSRLMENVVGGGGDGGRPVVDTRETQDT